MKCSSKKYLCGMLLSSLILLGIFGAELRLIKSEALKADQIVSIQKPAIVQRVWKERRGKTVQYYISVFFQEELYQVIVKNDHYRVGEFANITFVAREDGSLAAYRDLPAARNSLADSGSQLVIMAVRSVLLFVILKGMFCYDNRRYGIRTCSKLFYSVCYDKQGESGEKRFITAGWDSSVWDLLVAALTVIALFISMNIEGDINRMVHMPMAFLEFVLLYAGCLIADKGIVYLKLKKGKHMH